MADDDHVIIRDESGFKSRKLFVVVLAKILVLVGAILSAKWTTFAPSFETYVGGIIAIASMYVIGNVSSTFLSGKVNASVKVASFSKPSDIKPEEENK